MKNLKLQTSKQAIDKLNLKISELENNWKRALADYRNLEQRVAEQKSEWAKMTEAGVIIKLLPILDDLNLVLAHQADVGIRMIKDRLISILKEMGITEVDPTGKEYDPTAMECAETVAGPKDRVIKTVFSGYKLYDRIIRVARVTVGNGDTV